MCCCIASRGALCCRHRCRTQGMRFQCREKPMLLLAVCQRAWLRQVERVGSSLNENEERAVCRSLSSTSLASVGETRAFSLPLSFASSKLQALQTAESRKGGEKERRRAPRTRRKKQGRRFFPIVLSSRSSSSSRSPMSPKNVVAQNRFFSDPVLVLFTGFFRALSCNKRD